MNNKADTTFKGGLFTSNIYKVYMFTSDTYIEYLPSLNNVSFEEISRIYLKQERFFASLKQIWKEAVITVSGEV